MFEVGNTYPTVNGKGNYTSLKIVVGDFPIHAYDYARGEFSTFTLEGKFQKSGASGKDLVQPMKIGQKLIDNEGDEWYLLPNNVVTCPSAEAFGKLEGDHIYYDERVFTYDEA